MLNLVPLLSLLEPSFCVVVPFLLYCIFQFCLHSVLLCYFTLSFFLVFFFYISICLDFLVCNIYPFFYHPSAVPFFVLIGISLELILMFMQGYPATADSCPEFNRCLISFSFTVIFVSLISLLKAKNVFS